MKTGTIFLTCVLFIVLAISLYADQSLVNPVGEFSAISINSKEEVVHEAVSAPVYEILAVKPAEIKQIWLPSSSVISKVNIADPLRCSKPRGKIRNNIHRRIRSPV